MEWRKGQRLTKSYLKKWIDAKMVELEIPLRVVSIGHTRLRGHEYEGGAAVYIITTEGTKDAYSHTPVFLMFLTIEQIQGYLNNDYKLSFRARNQYSLSDAEITVVR